MWLFPLKEAKEVSREMGIIGRMRKDMEWEGMDACILRLFLFFFPQHSDVP